MVAKTASRKGATVAAVDFPLRAGNEMIGSFSVLFSRARALLHYVVATTRNCRRRRRRRLLPRQSAQKKALR